MDMTLARTDFPAEFIFGAATAAYQIEGAAHGNCGVSHWDTFAATPGNVVNAETGALACDHYHRFCEDLDLVRAAGFGAYRFSTSWSRILPEGRGTPNRDGLDFYDRLADAILERGLKPYLTLYHWELPAALSDLGGWRNRDVAGWFADYTEIVAKLIGDRMAAVATINEPWCVSWLSHFIGAHAPGMRDIRATARAMHHVLLAHARAIEVLRANAIPKLGIVLNFEHANPASNSDADIAAAKRHDGIYNRWFVQALMHGTYPADILDTLAAHMPTGFNDDMAAISAPLDWLGVNYYTRSILRDAPRQPWPSLEAVEGPLPKTAMDWEVYPDGLYATLSRLKRDYTGDLPIIVTENGMASDDRIEDGTIADRQRIAYFNDHLAAVMRATNEGVPVGGYFAWSLLDNYEWALGYGKRFGLVHVDYETQRRTPKASYEAFRRMLIGDSGTISLN